MTKEEEEASSSQRTSSKSDKDDNHKDPKGADHDAGWGGTVMEGAAGLVHGAGDAVIGGAHAAMEGTHAMKKGAQEALATGTQAVAKGVEGAGGIVKGAVHEVDAFGKDLKDDVNQMRIIAPTKQKDGTPKKKDDDGDDKEGENSLDSALFNLVGEMLFGSSMIYFLADFRAMVAEFQDEMQGDPTLIDKFLHPPITGTEIMEVFKANGNFLFGKMHDRDMSLYMAALEKYGQAFHEELIKADNLTNKHVQKARSQSNTALRRHMQTKNPTVVAVFDDANSERELVYAIKVDRENRALNVVFRGSVTVRDWAVDAQITLTAIPNPLYSTNDSATTIPQQKEIAIHSGFYHYLFGILNKDGENKQSKYDQIMANVRALLDQHPEYSIRTTGHSLGGALATLFAFQIVQEKDIKLPVLCITFAAPKPGNVGFARAFQELELQKKIVCLRVSNQNDIIPQIPDRLTCLTFLCQDAIFRQVGIELKLYRPKENNNRLFRFFYPRVHRSRSRQLVDDFQRSFGHAAVNTICKPRRGCCRVDLIANHGVGQYMERLYAAQSHLTKVSMHDVFYSYHEKVSAPSAVFFAPSAPEIPQEVDEKEEEEKTARREGGTKNIEE